MNFNIGPCILCEGPMTLQEVREGVQWAFETYWTQFFPEELEERVAHRRCWQGLSERRRRKIRLGAHKLPKSLGVIA